MRENILPSGAMKIRIYVSTSLIFAVNAPRRNGVHSRNCECAGRRDSSSFSIHDFLLASPLFPVRNKSNEYWLFLPHSASSRASFGWKPLILIDFMFLCKEFPWRLIFHDPIFHSAQQSPGIYNLIYYIKHNYDFFHASFLDYRSISTANAPHTITINFSLAARRCRA